MKTEDKVDVFEDLVINEDLAVMFRHHQAKVTLSMIRERANQATEWHDQKGRPHTVRIF